MRALRRGRWIPVALPIAAIALAAVLLWWRGPSIDAVAAVFRAVSWTWVGAALALNVVSVIARSLAWRTVIEQSMPPPRPRYRYVFSAFSVGLLANAVLPGRIGEVARVAVVARRLPRRGGSWPTLMGTVFAHRVFDLVAVLLLVPYVLVAARIPPWALTSIALLAATAVVLVVFAFAGARPHQLGLREGLGVVRRWLTMARNGLAVMREPFAAATAIALQCVGWGLQLLAVYAAMRAFRIDEPLHAAGLVLVLMNVATIFPLWPGNVGLVQAAVALPLLSYGIDYPHGFAFGLGLQAIEASVGAGLGLLFLAREGLSLAMLRRLPPSEAPPERSPAGDTARSRVTGLPQGRARGAARGARARRGAPPRRRGGGRA
ncbi:MAG: flippase-like domain-containing protein, partial [Thermoleophilia bacterium]|nr:flippase-like domain-containing protein [Thermoleophilia bacterium]